MLTQEEFVDKLKQCAIVHYDVKYKLIDDTIYFYVAGEYWRESMYVIETLYIIYSHNPEEFTILWNSRRYLC